MTKRCERHDQDATYGCAECAAERLAEARADQELAALGEMIRLLEPFDLDTRHRMFDYLLDRFGSTSAPAKRNTP